MMAVLIALLGLSVVADGPLPRAQGPAPGQAAPNQTAPLPLVDTHWTLVSVGDLTLVPRHEASGPHLVFDAHGGMSGSDGCNSVQGTYTADRFTMTVRAAPGTAGACARPDRLGQRLREVLRLTRRWTIEEGMLTLRDGSGTALARFQVKFDGR